MSKKIHFTWETFGFCRRLSAFGMVLLFLDHRALSNDLQINFVCGGFFFNFGYFKVACLESCSNTNTCNRIKDNRKKWLTHYYKLQTSHFSSTNFWCWISNTRLKFALNWRSTWWQLVYFILFVDVFLFLLLHIYRWRPINRTCVSWSHITKIIQNLIDSVSNWN